jgi:hypothetical protein
MQYVKYTAMPYLLERGAVDTLHAFNISGMPAPGWANREDLNPIWVASNPRSVKFMLSKGIPADVQLLLPCSTVVLGRRH